MTNYFQPDISHMKCARCNRELKRGEVVYKMVRGRYGSGYGYVSDWPDYDPFAGFIFICEQCSGFRGEWKE